VYIYFLFIVKEKLKKLNFLLITICVLLEKTYVRSYSQDTAAAAILPSINIRDDVSNGGMNIISYSSSTLKLVYSH
jgi:hypothetical protein